MVLKHPPEQAGSGRACLDGSDNGSQTSFVRVHAGRLPSHGANGDADRRGRVLETCHMRFRDVSVASRMRVTVGWPVIHNCIRDADVQFFGTARGAFLNDPARRSRQVASC